MNQTNILKTIVSLCVLAVAATTARAADLANLTGRFVFDGKPPQAIALEPTKDQEVCSLHRIYDDGLMVDESGGIANAVIMLKTKNVPIAPSYEASAKDKITLDNQHCRFEPHVVVLRAGQTLNVTNSDPIAHNTNISPQLNPGANPMLPAGGAPVTWTFAQEEGSPVKVGCNIHPWMGAFVIARKDPYAAVSDKAGKFTIKDLPANTELEFALWTERSDLLKNVAFKGGKSDTKGRFKIKLKPGDNDLGDIKVTGAMLKVK